MYGRKLVSFFHSLVAGGKADMEAGKVQSLKSEPAIAGVFRPFANTLFQPLPKTVPMPFHPEFQREHSNQTGVLHIRAVPCRLNLSCQAGGVTAKGICRRKAWINLYKAALSISSPCEG
jgi:hypothetical protein